MPPPDRKIMLKKYLSNELFKEFTSLSEQQVKDIDFSSKTSDPLVEALKKLIFSFCQTEAQVTIIRNVNREIEKTLDGASS
jgi:hypothetical protein